MLTRPSLALLTVLILGAAETARATASGTAGQPQTSLPEAIEDIEAEIAARRDEIVMLDRRIEASEGLVRTIFITRADRARLELLDLTVEAARKLHEAREHGVDVDAGVADTKQQLESLPQSVIDAAGRLRERFALETEYDTPGASILAQRQLAMDSADLDRLFSTAIGYLGIAPEFGVDTGAERTRIAALLAESAANRSVYLEVADREAAKLQTAVSRLANDDELRSWLSAAEVRRTVAVQALESAVRLMSRLELDTRHYRRQLLSATGEVTTDVLDVGFMADVMREWTRSTVEAVKQQGPGALFRLFLALLLLLAFAQLGKIIQRIVGRLLNAERVQLSHLLRKMVLSTVRNVFVIIGFLVALSQLGVSIGPLLAGLGIAGFIVGFALQDSLSNFASGMMILIYRPFDVGDFVEVVDVQGYVRHMTLVNTTLLTIDNRKLVMPNNTVWRSIIGNYTGQSTRRVDLEFRISYHDDIDRAEAVTREILGGYDALLDRPEPIVKVGSLGDSSVNLIVRPWVRTEDYWDTYWDLTKLIKLAFDREGITIPFPQRTVHVAGEAASPVSGSSGNRAGSPIDVEGAAR